MEYKVLINLYISEIEENYEFYIPVNKHVDEVISILNKAVNEITYGVYPIKENLELVNRRTGEVYEKGAYIRNTSIKNGTQLVIY
jgi:hypothetical protein